MENKEKEMLQNLSKGGKHYLATSGYRRGYGAVASDKTPLAEKLLKEAGIKFSVGNDAPRGGLNGKFIKNSKFSYEKALQKIEAKRLRQKFFDEGQKYATEIFEEKLRKLCLAIFGTAGFETSQSGNIYGIMQKPTRWQVEQGGIPEGLRRISNGKLQVFKNGKWENFN